MKIKQHLPGYMDFTPSEGEFATLDELRAIPWVKKWIDDPTFHQLSQSGHGDTALLMAELKGGKSWYVIGYLNDVVDGLPQWVSPGNPAG